MLTVLFAERTPLDDMDPRWIIVAGVVFYFVATLVGFAVEASHHLYRHIRERRERKPEPWEELG